MKIANKQIGNEGIISISQALCNNNSLQILSFSSKWKIERDWTAVDIEIKEEGIKSITKMLQLNKSIQQLYLYG